MKQTKTLGVDRVRIITNKPVVKNGEHAFEQQQPTTLVAATEREKALIAKIVKLERRLSACHDRVAGKDVVCLMPVSNGDVGLAVTQLEWMAELGGNPESTVVIWTPHGMSPRLVYALMCAAEDAWGAVEHGSTPFDLSNEGWPQGPSWMFATAAQWCHERRVDFLLLEPDAVPLKPDWFTRIVGEYRRCGRPYMGTVEFEREKCPRHMPGNAVYPWTLWERNITGSMVTPWDVLLAEQGNMELCAETKLIHQIWGTDAKAPSFRSTDDLAAIRKEAVLFHRCKDGSLIRQLKKLR